MTAFATFIGKSYYSRENFIQESLKLGCSRRISYRLIGSFNWGDTVVCLQGDQAKKNRKNALANTDVLGSFRVERLGGIPAEVIPQMVSDLGIVLSHNGAGVGDLVIRGCGEYHVAGTYVIATSTLPELAFWLRQNGDVREMNLLLQGKFTPMTGTIGGCDRQVFLRDLHQRWGMRYFDLTLFRTLVNDAIIDGQDPIILDGEFIPKGRTTIVKGPAKTFVQFVDDYQTYGLWRGPLWGPEQKSTAVGDD